jgi:CheY-like chemotaxis protein
VASQQWVLVADDDPRVLAIWTEALTDAGYRVLTACNGGDVLALMRSLVSQCIVLDLRMPGVSGADFLALTEDAPALRRIPIVVVSGFLAEHAEVLRTTRLNVITQLQKPVRPVELVHAVQVALAVPPRG